MINAGPLRVTSEKQKKTIRYLRVLWNSRQRHERWRDCVSVICNCMYGNEEENGVLNNVESVRVLY